ncbi:MAG TPA: pentapeptide repeat-containing protein [Desulfuromonadaceae bacterium]|jgi:hypothetical protein
MNSLIRLSVAAGLLLALSTPEVQFSSARAAEDGAQAGKPAPVAPPAEEASKEATAAKEKKVVVKRKKRRKKGTVKKSEGSTIESSPGEKLSLKQVLEILKTTRDLSGKNLGGLQLVGVNLSRCNLKGVDLSHANMERADLEESSLERADLTGANLRMSNLRLSGMTGANLENAILDGAVWRDGRVCASGSVGQCREFAPPSRGK